MNTPSWLGVALFLIGLGGLLFKNQISNMVAKVGSPLGLKVKTTLVILSIAGIMLGGFATAWGWVQDVSGGTASIIGSDSEDVAGVSAGVLDCKFTSAPTEINSTAGSMRFRSDPSADNNYFVDAIYTEGSDRVQGYLKCENNRPNIREGVSFDCYAKADTFRSETSSTDSNTYTISGTNVVVSQVPGVSWQQDIFLGDKGTTATASALSDGYETTKLTYAQDEVSQYIGFNFTLPGNTVYNYLLNQSTKQVKIYCAGAEVGKVTITKVSA